jgi:hypothetical protein
VTEQRRTNDANEDADKIFEAFLHQGESTPTQRDHDSQEWGRNSPDFSRGDLSIPRAKGGATSKLHDGDMNEFGIGDNYGNLESTSDLPVDSPHADLADDVGKDGRARPNPALRNVRGSWRLGYAYEPKASLHDLQTELETAPDPGQTLLFRLNHPPQTPPAEHLAEIARSAYPSSAPSASAFVARRDEQGRPRKLRGVIGGVALGDLGDGSSARASNTARISTNFAVLRDRKMSALERRLQAEENARLQDELDRLEEERKRLLSQNLHLRFLGADYAQRFWNGKESGPSEQPEDEVHRSDRAGKSRKHLKAKRRKRSAKPKDAALKTPRAAGKSQASHKRGLSKVGKTQQKESVEMKRSVHEVERVSKKGSAVRARKQELAAEPGQSEAGTGRGSSRSDGGSAASAHSRENAFIGPSLHKKPPIRDQLRRFFLSRSLHEKLGNIEKIVEAYHGHEALLWRRLHEKYDKPDALQDRNGEMPVA